MPLVGASLAGPASADAEASALRMDKLLSAIAPQTPANSSCAPSPPKNSSTGCTQPPFLAACAAQGLRENPLLWLLCTRLPQAPGCFAPTARTEISGELRGGRSNPKANRFNASVKVVLPKLRSAAAIYTLHSTHRTLPTMSKLHLPKISSLDLGAGFEPSNSGFARPKPRKDLPVARFCPYSSTKFCYLDVQLFQKDQRWPGNSFDDGP